MRSFLFVVAALMAGCAAGPSAPPNQLSVTDARGDMPIQWLSIPRPAPQTPLAYGAILVPITIEGLTAGKRLYMQFDLGHPSTVLYSNKWASLAPKIAPSSGARYTAEAERITNLRFKLGTLAVTAAEVQVRKREGPAIDWDGAGTEIIGTVGSDIVDGRTVALDFKSNTITIARDRMGLAASESGYTPFTYMARRILMPAVVNGETQRIIYDSGSSAFALITDEASWKKFARANAVPVQFPVKSWGNTLTAHVVESDAKVQLGKATIPVGEVSRIEGASFLQEAGMRAFGIAGMAGNKLFIGRKLILDTARQEFLVEE